MAQMGRPALPRVEVECAACGAKLLRSTSAVERNRSGRFFCDAACLAKTGSKPRTGIQRPCETCGTEFYARTRSIQRFCSKECADVYQARNSEQRTCAHCGGNFRMPPSSPDRFCNRACYDMNRQTPVGSRKRTSDGYIVSYQPEHPDAQGTGWFLEHRLVMERMIGRALLRHENVHHRNGRRDDNRESNLELWVSSQPSGQRVEDVVAHARQMLALYEPLVGLV